MSAPGIHLLLPALRRWRQPWPGDVATALGRADRTPVAADAALAGVFGWADVPASAALARLGEGDLATDEIRAHRWLRADPAWIRADINGARLLGIGPMLRPDAEDVAAFADELRVLLATEQIALDIVHPTRWYLRLPADAELPRFATPAEALGEDAFDHRVEGADARRWRRLDSEAQVSLHQSPRNGARQAAGLPPINALWFWGDAPMPDAARRAIPMLASDDPLLRGAARLAMIDPAPLPAVWPANANGLYDLRGVPADRLYTDWLQPALQAMRTEGITMQWICDEGPVFQLDRGQRLRFWRKALAAPVVETPE